jgi:hypothetical protein
MLADPPIYTHLCLPPMNSSFIGASVPLPPAPLPRTFPSVTYIHYSGHLHVLVLFLVPALHQLISRPQGIIYLGESFVRSSSKPLRCQMPWNLFCNCCLTIAPNSCRQTGIGRGAIKGRDCGPTGCRISPRERSGARTRGGGWKSSCTSGRDA